MMRSLACSTLATGVIALSAAPVVAAPGDQRLPAVAYSQAADLYFVVWKESPAVFGVRIDSTGTILDRPPIKLPVVAGSYAADPAVASDGEDFLVVWSDGRNRVDNDLYGAYVRAANGSVFPPRGFAVASHPLQQDGPDLAFEPVSKDFLVAWVNHDVTPSTHRIRGARVHGTTVLDPLGFDLSGTSGRDFGPAVAAGKLEFLVVWNDGRHAFPAWTTGWDIYGSFVSNGGAILTPGAFQVSNNAENEFTPAVAYGDNGEYSVLWEDRRNGGAGHEDIYSTCIQSQGGGAYTIVSPSGTPMVRAPEQQRWVSTAYSNGRYMLVWGDDRTVPGDHEIRGVGADHCDPLHEFKVSSAPGFQGLTSIASDRHGNFLAVWEDNRPAAAPGTDIYGALIAPDGTLLVPDILIAH